MTEEKIKENLCYYDLRNPDGVKDDLDEDEIKELKYGNFRKPDCLCDNCFYGRSEMAEELLTYKKLKHEIIYFLNTTTTYK